MKHEPNQDPTPAELEMQEKLCAYLFGELDAAERAHVESRLAESAAWRAEHERLAGTISLVQGAMTDLPSAKNTLSAAAMDNLQAVARKQTNASKGGSVLFMRRFMPVAAGLIVVLGGVWMAGEQFQRTGADGISGENVVASRPEASTFAPDSDELAAVDARDDALGQLVANDRTSLMAEVVEFRRQAEPVAKKSAGELKDESSWGEPAGELEGMASRGLENTESKPGGPSAGFYFDEGSDGGARPDGRDAKSAVPVRSAGADSSGTSRSGLPEFRVIPSGGIEMQEDAPQPEANVYLLRSGAAPGAEVTDLDGILPPSASPQEIVPGGVVTGEGDWLLGKGTAGSAKLQDAARGPATGHGGHYRGPGDSVAAGGGGAPGGGPGTPGSAPGTPGAPGPGAPTGQPIATEAMRFDLARYQEVMAREDSGASGNAPSEKDAASKEDTNALKWHPLSSGSEAKASAELPAVVAGLPVTEEEVAELAEVEAVIQDFEISDHFETDQEAPAAETRGRFDRKTKTPDPRTREEIERDLRAAMEARAAARCQEIVVTCTPRPKDSLRDMYFRWWGDNPFVYTSSDPLATFAADVDTASYTLARRYLVDGYLPTKEQIRTEEFVNYFDGDVAPPTDAQTFAVESQVVQSPFGGGANRYMLRVGVRGKVVPKNERPPMSLVYVVDTSGSMREGNRMELVKHSLRLLGTELDGRDQVGIVAFNSQAHLVLPMTSMDERATLESALQGLSPDGSTNVEDGMRLGYELLSRVPGEGRLRRVVLISDGVANTGNTTAETILAQVQDHRKNGILLSTIGVGMGNHNDALLERLADRGDGICDYVDDEQQARKAMVERFSGGFIPIARDLKIQVEFDGKHVLRYRQLGYENRAVADKDFRNDAVDGGEVGSGHQVTALFELDCVDLPAGKLEEALRLGTVRLRYKSVATGADETVTESEFAVSSEQPGQPMEAATPGMQRSLVAAQFAEVLRRSSHAQTDDFGALLAAATRVADLPEFAGDNDTRELRGMIERAGSLGLGERPRLSELDQTVDVYKRHRYLVETERQLRGQLEQQRLNEIERINRELEARIRDLCLEEARQGR
ncbi:MAG: von Willebrand factor type A domain-containing protein [Planctomycetota bacterium]